MHAVVRHRFAEVRSAWLTDHCRRRVPSRSVRTLAAAQPAVGMSARRLAKLTVVVRKALGQGRMPGCVVAIGRHGKLVYLRAFGARQTTPETRGDDRRHRVRSGFAHQADCDGHERHDPGAGRARSTWTSTVATYLPEFGNRGKEAITVRQLLTHLGGLTPDNALADYADGPDKAWERICGLELRAQPGTDFIYSDVGFIVLGELVQRVSGERTRSVCAAADLPAAGHAPRPVSCRTSRCARGRQ